MTVSSTPRRLPWRLGHVEWVEVKQEHIDKGIPSECSRCPIALAVADHFRAKFPGTDWEADVSESSCAVYEFGSGQDMYNYAHNGRDFIATFDSDFTRGDVVPFKLRLAA